MSDKIIEMIGIQKKFNDIIVLKNVNFDVKYGEVHTIFGENGAGKSVLMKVLSGVFKPDFGSIYIEGNEIEFNSPSDAQSQGISTIYQEQYLFDYLTVAENIFISKISQLLFPFSIINRGKMIDKSKQILEKLNFNIDPTRPLKELGFGEKKMVEIAKMCINKSKVIIMDEPTNCLTEFEIENLYKTIERLKREGISIIFISHSIEDVLRISDRITIIKDGEIVTTDCVGNFNRELLLNLSAGDDYKERYPKLPVQKGRIFFKVNNLSTYKKISNINFELKKGEILGIAGLVGSGRSAIARAIFGLDRIMSGNIILDGTKLVINSPNDAIKHGIGYISDDRLQEGLIGNFTIPENISLSNLKGISYKYFLSKVKENNIARKFVKKLVIKTPYLKQKAINLSGGNQQKTLVSKWMFSDSKLLILDEPTIGLDTGSKVEVYNIMNKLVMNNSGIILISSDISELIGMSDRILVIYNGTINKELSREEFSPEKILYYSSIDETKTLCKRSETHQWEFQTHH